MIYKDKDSVVCTLSFHLFHRALCNTVNMDQIASTVRAWSNRAKHWHVQQNNLISAFTALRKEIENYPLAKKAIDYRFPSYVQEENCQHQPRHAHESVKIPEPQLGRSRHVLLASTMRSDLFKVNEKGIW